MNKIYVLAGNFHGYEQFLKDAGLSRGCENVVYLYGLETMKGITHGSIIYYGNYMKREDYNKIQKEIDILTLMGYLK